MWERGGEKKQGWPVGFALRKLKSQDNQSEVKSDLGHTMLCLGQI